MTAALFLLGAALFGIGLTKRFFGSILSNSEQALWGFIVGWCLAGLMVYGAARAFEHITMPLVLLVTAILWIAGTAFWIPILRNVVRLNYRQLFHGWLKRLLPLGVVLIFFAPIYVRLFDTHMLRPGADGGLYSGGESTSYDIAFHAAVTTS